MIAHFYHVWADGAWQEPAAEHVSALADAGFRADVITIGVTGGPGRRARVRDALGAPLAALSASPVRWAERRTGFEQVTLAALCRWLAEDPGEAAVLYAHTKGAYNSTAWNAAWRRSMTRHVAGGWRHCVQVIEDGCDTAGCYWLTPERFREPPFAVTSPFYGGNFWWARASYLRRLPRPGPARHDAERWIGLAAPQAYDLLPGWPCWARAAV